jgi:hypothetical protein
MRFAAFPARLRQPYLRARVSEFGSCGQVPKRGAGGLKCALATVALAVAFAGSAARAAEAAPRAAVVDALVLTPALENADTRGVAERAVGAAIRQKGWNVVQSSSSCRDIGCARTVAATANTDYLVILVGRFVPGESYATDLGVLLWRDGVVIADRREIDEVREEERSGGGSTILRCGPPAGACTAQLLVSKLEKYAGEVASDETAAIHRRDAIQPVALGPRIAPSPPLVEPTVEAAGGGGSGRVWGWTLVGGGVALGGGAAVLWAFNNTETDCHSAIGDGNGCRQERRTGTAAAALGIAALGGAAAGILVFVLNHGRSHMALSMQPTGMALKGRF